jgi:hypothetical protein
MIDRGSLLRQFPFQWPELSLPVVVTALRWLMAIVFLVGVLWLISLAVRRWQGQTEAPEEQ